MNSITQIRNSSGKRCPKCNYVRTSNDWRLMVNARDNSQSTPLHFAAFRGNIYMAELFIRKGADVNDVDQNGMTPAKVAIWQKHLKTAALIRKHGG